MIEFGEVSGSRGPIHTDREIATRLFGGPVVQAALLMEQALAAAIEHGRWPTVLESTSIDARFLKLVLTEEPFTVEFDDSDAPESIALDVNNHRGCAVAMRVFDRRRRS